MLIHYLFVLEVEHTYKILITRIPGDDVSKFDTVYCLKRLYYWCLRKKESKQISRNLM